MAPLRGNMLYISCYRIKHEKILSETVRPRALIFDMYYLLVDLYQVKFVQIMPLGPKMAPP